MTVSSKTFNTRFGYILTAVTLLLLVVLSLLTDDPIPHHGRLLEDSIDYSTQSCGSLNEVTPYPGDDQCAFAKACNRNKGVWAPIVYCSGSRGRVWLGVLSPIMLLWMIMLFRMLGSTAEEYFSPSLEMFSTKLGLPPRFAGVSLLALGNGAADVSATVSAITNDPVNGYKMSLGALSGAAMLISGVISATVILTAQGVPCRGALVRDVTALMITVGVVWTQLRKGVIGTEAVTLFVTLYAVFVLLVLAADVYHRAVVLPRLAQAAGTAEEQRQMEDDHQIVQPKKSGRLSHMLTALSNYDNVSTRENTGVESDDLVADRPIQLHGQGGLLSRQSTTSPTNQNPAQDQDHTYALLESNSNSLCSAQNGSVASSWSEAWQKGREEIAAHAERTYDDIVYDGDLNVVQKFLLFCELPFTVLRKNTVPIPCEGFYCRGLVALSLILSPLWLAFYLHLNYAIAYQKLWMPALIMEAVMLVIGLTVLRFSPGGERASMALPYATPIALFGFVMAATWIDTIANALVSLLNFIGIVLRIPGPILGLTILAWGNSMGDLSANITMARKGLANMAMTACFAGPVFNVLIGLGMGFSSLFAHTGESETEVTLSPSVETGFLFLLLNAVLLLGVGFTVGKIPKRFGYAALVLYVVYLITSICLQYSKYGREQE